MLQVLLHDPREKPLMLERGFKISPGFLTQVAVNARYVSIPSYRLFLCKC